MKIVKQVYRIYDQIETRIGIAYSCSLITQITTKVSDQNKWQKNKIHKNYKVNETKKVLLYIYPVKKSSA